MKLYDFCIARFLFLSFFGSFLFFCGVALAQEMSQQEIAQITHQETHQWQQEEQRKAVQKLRDYIVLLMAEAPANILFQTAFSSGAWSPPKRGRGGVD